MQGIINLNCRLSFSSEMILTRITDASYQIPLNIIYPTRLLHSPKQLQQHFLYQILGILTPPDTHVCKTEQPVLPLCDNPFQFNYVLFRLQ
jgi:hypothetical protein